MAKKVKPSAEDSENNGIETHGSDETAPPDYDVEMNKWYCRRLKLLCEQLEIDNRESAHERQQRRKIGLVVAVVAGVVPVMALVILFIVMLYSPMKFSGGMSAMVLIFASFSSMVVIYAFLIRGMFPGVIQKNDTNSQHPVADETMKAARSVISGNE